MISLVLFKMGKHSMVFISASNRRYMTGFYSCHKTDKKFLRLNMVLGDAVSKLETFVWILKHISRSITLSLFTLKASYSVK